MRAKLPAALLLAVLAIAGAQPALSEAASPRPELGPARTPTVARAAASRAPTVSRVLSTLLSAGQLTQQAYSQDLAVYIAAKGALAGLTGTRHAELQAVLANVQAIAGAGQLSASRLPSLLLTLERNVQVWSGPTMPQPDAHVSFPGSELVWEYYPGQGVEIQWLATFGEGNGFYLAHQSAQLRQLLGEAIPLAAQRAGGIAWEYLFHFDGGVPPWTSGLSQGTALQLLARAYVRLKEPAYLTAAQQALGLFEVSPPQGVRVDTPAGALYAEYTFAPSDRILNGFIQALVGLYEYAALTKEPLGGQLFEAGDAEARTIVPLYNTGAWSKYDQFGESDLNYHALLAEFLQHLCERTRAGAPLDPAGPLTADAIYCTTAAEFDADLHTPPALELLSHRLSAGTRAGVQVSLSKIAEVQLTITGSDGQVVRSVGATLERGDPRLLWVTPSRPGSYTASLTATDLAGNRSTASGTIVVTAPKRRPKPSGKRKPPPSGGSPPA